MKWIFLLLCLSTQTLYAAKFKCWTNDEGVRECGNSIPPQYIRQRIEYHNDKSGTLTSVKEASKTEEQLLAEEEEKRRVEKLEKEIAKQKAYDDVLLKTYLSVDDLLLSLNWKITTLDSRISVARGSIRNFQQQFLKYSKKAADIQRSGNKIQENLQKKLEESRNGIKRNEDKIAGMQQDKVRISNKFSHDVDRFVTAKNNGLRSVLKKKSKARELNYAQVNCLDEQQCERLWQDAKRFVKEHAALDIIFDTDVVYTTISPQKVDDLAFMVSKIKHIDINESDTRITFNIRCHPSQEGEKICDSTQTKEYLDKFNRSLAE